MCARSAPALVAAHPCVQTFEATAKRLGVPFEIVHKKINMSDPHVPWQHEQFARQKVLAATLSSVPAARPHFGAANLFDRRVNAAALARNVRVLAETLAAHLYATNGTDVFNGDLAVRAVVLARRSTSCSLSWQVSPVYLEATAQGLVRFPRATPYMAHNRDAAALVDGVEKVRPAAQVITLQAFHALWCRSCRAS